MPSSDAERVIMNTVQSGILGGARTCDRSAGRGKSATLLRVFGPTAAERTKMQPVRPNLAWDWPIDAGFTPKPQFEFCDHMPQSADPSADFRSSGDSFSLRYFTFLEIVSPNFKPQSILDRAKEFAVLPSGDPATSSTPRGWTRVVDGGGTIRWQPDWVVSWDRRDFLASALVGDSPATAIDLADPTLLAAARGAASDLLAVEMPGEAPRALPYGANDLHALSIEAQWARIPIYPGAWYDSSIIGLAARAKGRRFVRSYSGKDVFSPDGLLRARVAEMIVAYRQKARLALSESFARSRSDTIADSSSLRVAGVDFSKGRDSLARTITLNAPSSAGVVDMEVRSTSDVPAIVGVIIERFSGARK